MPTCSTKSLKERSGVPCLCSWRSGQETALPNGPELLEKAAGQGDVPGEWSPGLGPGDGPGLMVPPLPPAAVAVVGSVAFSPKSRRPKAPSASRSEWLYSCVCPIAHAVGASARNGSPSACIYPINLTGIITRC